MNIHIHTQIHAYIHTLHTYIHIYTYIQDPEEALAKVIRAAQGLDPASPTNQSQVRNTYIHTYIHMGSNYSTSLSYVNTRIYEKQLLNNHIYVNKHTYLNEDTHTHM
jgi:hypothetical protein